MGIHSPDAGPSSAERFRTMVDDYVSRSYPVQLVSSSPASSLESLASALGCDVADLYKTVCLNYKEDGQRVLISVIVPASARVDLNKVAMALNVPANKLKSAQPDFIFEQTGFVPGGIPPFGYPGRRLIDSSLFSRSVIYAGGGNNLNEYSRFQPSFLTTVHPDAVIGDFMM